MKILARNRIDFHRSVDRRYPSEISIVLRYKDVFQFEESVEKDIEYKHWLQKTSIREGSRIFPLLNHRGVEVSILDETSLMHSKTLKSIDGCITIAKCKLKGYEKAVFESGGNTGTALTQYGNRAGIETFMFIPEENLFLLNSEIFKPQKAHLFSVENPGMVKEAAHLLTKLKGWKHIPEREWRYEASMFRGLFILEQMFEKGEFNWLTQTISAAFGPIGIYRVLKHFKQEWKDLPRFLGIQQEANPPMFRAWKDRGERTEWSFQEELLTKVMYDAQPQTYGTYEELKDILVRTRGDLTTINHQEFKEFLKIDFNGKNILELLRDHGVEITLKDGKVIEKTGLIALAGTFKEIEKGTIGKGEKVLCCLTSGVSDADGKARPEFRISKLEDILREGGFPSLG